MLTFTNSTVIRDNSISINGSLIGKLTDEEANKVITLIQQMTSNEPSNPGQLKTMGVKKEFSNDTEGKVLYKDDACVVTDCSDGDAKDYRLYITTPIKKVRAGIKMSAKNDFGTTFGGDFDKGILFWNFPNKTKAQAFIKAQKARNTK